MSENPDNISEFLKLVRTEFDPPLQQLINYQEENIINTSNEEDRICIVRVQKSDDIHSLKNGDTFIRRGNQNVKVGAQEILRLRYERGSIKYENEIVPKIGIDALDKELLNQYQVDTQSTGTDIWQFLRDNGLATTKNELTNASVLLFAKNPAVALGSKCSIKISHYYGTKQMSGSPYNQHSV